MSTKRPERYKRLFFLGIILIALGVIFSTTLADKVGSLGTVFVALGVLMMIFGMGLKRRQNDTERK